MLQFPASQCTPTTNNTCWSNATTACNDPSMWRATAVTTEPNSADTLSARPDLTRQSRPQHATPGPPYTAITPNQQIPSEANLHQPTENHKHVQHPQQSRMNSTSNGWKPLTIARQKPVLNLNHFGKNILLKLESTLIYNYNEFGKRMMIMSYINVLFTHLSYFCKSWKKHKTFLKHNQFSETTNDD